MVRSVHVSVFFFLMLSQIFLSCAAVAEDEEDYCPLSFDCGHLGCLRFPFTVPERDRCGILAIHGCDDKNPNSTKTLQFSTVIGPNKKSLKLKVRYITEDKPPSRNVFVSHEGLEKDLVHGSCEAFSYNFTLPTISPLGYLEITDNVTLYKCKTFKGSPPKQFLNYTGCTHQNQNETIFFGSEDLEDPKTLAACSKVQLPVKRFAPSGDPWTFITAQFPIHVQISDDCSLKCLAPPPGGSQCRVDGRRQLCSKLAPADEKSKLALKLAIGSGIGLVGSFILAFVLVLNLRHYKRKYGVSHVRLRPGGPCLNDADPDSGRLFFGVPIFSYNELQEATNNFDPSKKLGDGGFGTVYYGKLQDGREVAVKHLFNYNYKRVEQFMNEVEILTRLRHKNLVSLYGCTSRQSSELLLVYEYIPNGTVASHLRGDLAKPVLLTWPIRIKIAIEIASALAYLHASDVIHRDIKTSNILLDNNFNVKVADFGLSRLFPYDVSHISTAPQGTPGYLDPEYHCCFQLTNKSDVYSFGVVLMELISSMPAVDVGRDKDDIALGNLAVRKIQRNEFEELVDPCLGIEKDSEVKRMVIAVGELAFQCLQRDNELRPSIDKVLQVLKRIESGKEEGDDAEEDDDDDDEILESKVEIHPPLVALVNWDQVGLKNGKSLSSPNNVAEKCESATNITV